VQGRAAKYYGTAGRAWLEHLVANTDTLSIDLRQRMDSIEAQLVPDGASGQVKRGVRRFALIAAAGEMATAAGLTGWEEHDATWAAQTCLDAWIASRGGAGNSELASILRQVRTFFEAHGDARFPYWHRIGDDHASKTINRAGLRRVFNVDGTPYKDIGNKAVDVPLGSVYEEGGTVIYYVLPEVFLGEVCKGIDIKAACELLKSSGCLLATEPGRYNVSTKLPGIGKVRCYCITDAIHSIDV
jgi:putative DNA primase/helicase